MTIKVLSNRADVISGGDALVQVVRPRDARRARFKVTVGGRDVSGAFRKDGVGLIEGLENGRNVVGGRRAKTVRGARRRVAVRLGARKGRTVRVLLKVRARRGGQRVTLSVRHTYQRCE